MNDDTVVNDSKADTGASAHEKPPRNPAKPIAIGVVLLLVVLVAGHSPFSCLAGQVPGYLK